MYLCVVGVDDGSVFAAQNASGSAEPGCYGMAIVAHHLGSLRKIAGLSNARSRFPIQTICATRIYSNPRNASCITAAGDALHSCSARLVQLAMCQCSHLPPLLRELRKEHFVAPSTLGGWKTSFTSSSKQHDAVIRQRLPLAICPS